MPYVPETVKKRQPPPRRYGGRRLDEFGNPLPTGGLLGPAPPAYVGPGPYPGIPVQPPVTPVTHYNDLLGPELPLGPAPPQVQPGQPALGAMVGGVGVQPTAPYSGLLQSNYNLGYEELARQRGLAGVRSRRPLTGYGAI